MNIRQKRQSVLCGGQLSYGPTLSLAQSCIESTTWANAMSMMPVAQRRPNNASKHSPLLPPRSMQVAKFVRSVSGGQLPPNSTVIEVRRKKVPLYCNFDQATM